MKKDYKNDSKKLTEALGGKENIKVKLIKIQ